MKQTELDKIQAISAAIGAPAVQQAVEMSVITNPAKEAEKSLITLLQHRTSRLQSSFEFEELVKATLETRIAEANFSQLMSLLDIVQGNNTRATEGIIAPFMANANFAEAFGSRSANETAAADVYAKTDDKRVLQGLVALNQLLDIIKAKQVSAGAVTAELVPSSDQNGDSTS